MCEGLRLLLLDERNDGIAIGKQEGFAVGKQEGLSLSEEKMISYFMKCGMNRKEAEKEVHKIFSEN